MQWCGRERDASLTPRHSLPVTDTRESTLPLPAAALRKAGSAPHLDSTVELTLLTDNLCLGDLAPALICHMAQGGVLLPTPPPVPRCLWQVGKLALRS